MKRSLCPLAALAVVLSGAAAGNAGPVFSDRLRIVANLAEQDVPPELVTFVAGFPFDPKLKSGNVFITEPNAPQVASDFVGLTVTPLRDPMMNIIGMATSVQFDSADTAVPNPLPPNSFTTPETGGPLNLTNRPDYFGSMLPFQLSVSSALENQPSNEPSDQVVIDATLVESTDFNELARFTAIYPTMASPKLQSADLYLTERGDPTVASDLIRLTVLIIRDNQNNPIAKQVSLALLSDPNPGASSCRPAPTRCRRMGPYRT